MPKEERMREKDSLVLFMRIVNEPRYGWIKERVKGFERENNRSRSDCMNK